MRFKNEWKLYLFTLIVGCAGAEEEHRIVQEVTPDQLEGALCRSGTAEQTIRRVKTALSKQNGTCTASQSVLQRLAYSLELKTQQAMVGGQRVQVYAAPTQVHGTPAHVNFELRFARDYPALDALVHEPVPSGDPTKPIQRLRKNPHLKCNAPNGFKATTRAVAPLLLTMGYVETRMAIDGGEEAVGVCSDGTVLTNGEIYEAEALLAYLIFLVESGHYSSTGTTVSMTIVRTGGAWLIRIAPVGGPVVAAGLAAYTSAHLLGVSFYNYAQSPNAWLCKFRMPCDRFSAGPYDARPFSAVACHLRENDMLIADRLEAEGYLDTWRYMEPDPRDTRAIESITEFHDHVTRLAYLDFNSCGEFSCNQAIFQETWAGPWSEQDYLEHGLQPGDSCAGCHGQASRSTPVDVCVQEEPRRTDQRENESGNHGSGSGSGSGG